MTFKYSKPFDWHFHFRHLVDDHDNLRHSLPSLEGTWITECWPICVFSFLLAISEVSCYLALKQFVFQDDMTTYLDFRKELAWCLINNPFLPPEISTASGLVTLNMDLHDIISAPPHASTYRN